MGFDLHFEKAGEGPPMLLVHGFASSSFTWRHVVDAFKDRFTVWTVDLLGHGHSAKPRDANYSVDSQSRLIVDFVREHDLHDATIGGHSFGGGVALRTAMELLSSEPERLRQLILVGSAAYEQEFPPFIKILRRPILGRVLPYFVPAKLSGLRALHFAYHDRSRITPDQIEGWAWPMRLPGTRASLRRTALEILPEDLDALTSRYPEIQVPTLLLWGQQDRIVPLSVGQRLHEALPNSRLEILDSCGHVPHEELPERSIALINDFLNEQAP